MVNKNIIFCQTCKYRKDTFTPCDEPIGMCNVMKPCSQYKRDEWNLKARKDIQFDSSDRDGMVKLMNNNELYGHIILCINQNGESMHLSIQEDRIDAHVFQHNHWIRHMVYHRDGTVEEMYEGKWTT